MLVWRRWTSYTRAGPVFLRRLFHKSPVTNYAKKGADEVPAAIKKWYDSVKSDENDALLTRSDLYKFFQEYKQPKIEFLSAVPEKMITLADLKIMTDAVLFNRPLMVGTLLRKLAPKFPTHVDYLLSYVISKLPTILGLPIFAGLLPDLGVNLANLKSYDQYVIILKQLVHKAGFNAALKGYLNDDPESCGRLCSTLMRHFYYIGALKTSQLAWELKVKGGLATKDDLHWAMFMYINQGQAERALELYDEFPELHEPAQNDALLLAAAQAHKWELLQSTFESLSKNFEDSRKKGIETSEEDFGSKHFAIVLKALGQLGGPQILDNIFEALKNDKLELTLGVFHGLVYSFGLLGDVDKINSLYKEMLEANIMPTRTTFQLILKGYSRSRQLSDAMKMLGDMVGKYQIPLTNSEASMALSICATRRDLLSGRKIWNWINSLIRPDLITWNTFLNMLAGTSMHEAYTKFKSMPMEPDLITLTTVATPFAKMGNAQVIKDLDQRRRSLKLNEDPHWLGMMLMYYVQVGNSESAVQTFQRLKALNKKLPSGYYTALLDLFTRQKLFKEAKELIKNFDSSEADPGFDLYKKYFRAHSLSSLNGLQFAHAVALKLLHEKFFDPKSRSLPRTSVPPSVVQPIIREHIKREQFTKAEELLELLRNQELKTPDVWQGTALYIELMHAMGKIELLGPLWDLFIKNLKDASVPTEVTTKSGVKVVRYRVPPQYRFNYWRQINAFLEHQVALGNEEVLRCDKILETYGLEMNTKNWNFLVKKLIDSGRVSWLVEAFSIVERKLAKNWLRSNGESQTAQPTLSKSTIRLLRRNVASLVKVLAVRKGDDPTKFFKKIPSLYPKTIKVLGRHNAKEKLHEKTS